MSKKTCFVHKESDHTAADVFTDHPKIGLVLKATVVHDQAQRFNKGEEIRTSLLVSISPDAQAFETHNTH